MADGYALRFDQVLYTAAEERLLSTVLAMPADRTHARPGRRAGSSNSLTVTTGGSPESAIIQGGGGVINDTNGGGSYLFVIENGTTSVPLTTRPSTGQSRIDVVVARILNGDERIADGFGVREVDLNVITGTPTSGTPAAPTVPTGQLQLAELVVPATGAISMQNPGPRTVALGGILPVASQTERDAIEAIYDGLMVYREDTDVYEARLNGIWYPAVERRQRGTASIPGTATSTRDGVVALDANIFKGATPSNVQLTPRDSWGDKAHCFTTSRAANTFTIRAVHIDGANFSAGTPVTVDWVAWA